MATSPASAVLEALGFVLFLRDHEGRLRLQGEAPAWLQTLWPSLTKSDELPLAEASPFLENFLIDAQECWTAGGVKRVQSGPWVEQPPDGGEVALEATALTSAGEAVLLLERLGAGFEEKKSMLQTARETVIAYQRLNSEIQKKEILLSCIAEEMNAALANAITSLRLIELQKNPERTQQLLTLAMRATEEQQALINKVINLFAAELENLYGRSQGEAAAASLGEALARAGEASVNAFVEKKVRLHLPHTAARVAMHREQLLRVLASLLESALENSPAGGEVTVEIAPGDGEVTVRIRDQGASLPHDIGRDLLATDFGSGTPASALQLRLQFCRMAVEKCHGEIGHEAAPGTGNCFWVRLPQAQGATE